MFTSEYTYFLFYSSISSQDQDLILMANSRSSSKYLDLYDEWLGELLVIGVCLTYVNSFWTEQLTNSVEDKIKIKVFIVFDFELVYLGKPF